MPFYDKRGRMRVCFMLSPPLIRALEIEADVLGIHKSVLLDVAIRNLLAMRDAQEDEEMEVG